MSQVFGIWAGVFFLYNMICVRAVWYAYLVSYVIFYEGLVASWSFVESILGKHGYFKIVQSGSSIFKKKSSSGRHNFFHVSLIGPHQRNQWTLNTKLQIYKLNTNTLRGSSTLVRYSTLPNAIQSLTHHTKFQ